MDFPVTIALVARAVPTRAGRSADAAGGNTPSVTSGRPKAADHVRGDDIALRMKEAERGPRLIGVESDLDRGTHDGWSCLASASAVVTGSRQAKSRHTKAVARLSFCCIAAMKGIASPSARW